MQILVVKIIIPYSTFAIYVQKGVPLPVNLGLGVVQGTNYGWQGRSRSWQKTLVGSNRGTIYGWQERSRSWQETLVGPNRELFMVGREGVEAGRKL